VNQLYNCKGDHVCGSLLDQIHFTSHVHASFFVMAAHLKKHLRVAREALGNKDFQEAKDASLRVLDHEPGNYNAYAILRYLVPFNID
jgi:hypothetical protein